MRKVVSPKFEVNARRGRFSLFLSKLFMGASAAGTALLADEVLAVEMLPTSRVREPTDAIHGLPSEYVRGVAERRGEGDGLLEVLNLSALLADKRLVAREETV